MSKKKIGMLIATMIIAGSLSGCIKPVNRPIIEIIQPNETAFLIPLVGQTSGQEMFASEELLSKAKVATKEIEIPRRWLQTGRFDWDGEWRPSARLIKVDRKVVTREWTEQEKTGSSNKNEGITAESKESIGFMMRVNASAYISESNAPKYLYNYNNKSLEDVMDTEIRARIESKLVEECAKYALEEILVSKEKIMDKVRTDVISYFDTKGVTITVIGLKGELTYLNPEIQKSIDERFKSAKSLETQRNENQRILEKAEADSKAVKIQNETIAQTIRLKELENQAKMIDKWNGQLSTYSGLSNSIIQLPTTGK